MSARKRNGRNRPAGMGGKVGLEELIRDARLHLTSMQIRNILERVRGLCTFTPDKG